MLPQCTSWSVSACETCPPNSIQSPFSMQPQFNQVRQALILCLPTPVSFSPFLFRMIGEQQKKKISLRSWDRHSHHYYDVRFRTNNARPHYQELVNLAFIICAVSGRSANFLGETSRFNSCALLCSRGSTIATVFLWASRPLRSCLFSGFYMRPPVSWPTWRHLITWHRRWWIITGCRSNSASTINCVATFTTYPLVMPLLTYPICW